MNERAQEHRAQSAEVPVIAGLREMLAIVDELASRSDPNSHVVETAAIHLQLAIDLLEEAHSA
jgi:hypothetical protein